MKLTRRKFLKVSFGVITAIVAACTRRPDSNVVFGPMPIVEPPDSFHLTIVGGPLIIAKFGSDILLKWTESRNAEFYDVELNGVLVSQSSGLNRELRIGYGNGKVGYQEGVNTCRIRARNSNGEVWSDEKTFEVLVQDGVRARRFDYEDDGPISLTTASAGSTMLVGSRFAFGSGLKGVSLECFDAKDTRAYKNHLQLPVENCWVRLAVNPQNWERDSVDIHLVSIRSSGTKANEHLIFRTGHTVGTSSIPRGVSIPEAEWSQLQFGVMADGTVEFWTFDGKREFLVGRGFNNELMGTVKDLVSLGNNLRDGGITYEIWLDEFAVAENKMPWANAAERAQLVRPKKLDTEEIPQVFSFVFGSCNVTSFIPYKNTALQAAADVNPDFVIHLGDHCYPDTGAYRQSKGGYLALWSDLSYEAQLNRLLKKPWLYLASDHDLGGNNIDSTSISTFASEAYAAWHSNPLEADPLGRYGSLSLDEGRILLIWTEGIVFRSPLSQPDGPEKTVLGKTQKKWLLELLGSSEADLIIIASQAALLHESATGWSSYPTERQEILEACIAAGGLIRWISGDQHSARWARLGEKIVEWGAAPFSEVPQKCPVPASFVDESTCISSQIFSSRAEFLDNRTLDQMRSSTSFGRVRIDTIEKTATFEVRDNNGNIRVDDRNIELSEFFSYARGS